MTEPRWDLIHDAVITDDEPEPDCDGTPTDVRVEERDEEPDVTGSDCA